MATKTTRWTLTMAASVLAEQQESGMCIARFAQAHGLSPKRLYRWRQCLKPAEPSPRSMQSATTALVPVEVVHSRAAPPLTTTTHAASLSLRTAAGHTIEIPSGFDGDTLLRVLDVLAEAERC